MHQANYRQYLSHILKLALRSEWLWRTGGLELLRYALGIRKINVFMISKHALMFVTMFHLRKLSVFGDLREYLFSISHNLTSYSQDLQLEKLYITSHINLTQSV
jgi:hypothetical protein